MYPIYVKFHINPEEISVLFYPLLYALSLYSQIVTQNSFFSHFPGKKATRMRKNEWCNNSSSIVGY